MADSGKTIEYFGSPIDQDLYNQLMKREELIADPIKSQKQRSFLYSNKPWVKLRSSVNIGKNADKAAEKAKAFAITNLQTYYKNDKYQGRSGIGRKSGEDGVYRNQQSRGFRPVPGITSVNLKSDGQHGFLLRATINITVWSLEDLEAFDEIYFRPGFTALLEFGHTVYLDAKGNVNSLNVDAATLADDYWFTSQQDKDGSNAFLKITKAISEMRGKNSGNFSYEGFIGYINNFQWSIRPDGGYDVVINMVSNNQILDSFKMPTAEDKDIAEKTAEEIEEEKKKERGEHLDKHNRSIIDQFCHHIDSYSPLFTDDETKSYQHKASDIFSGDESFVKIKFSTNKSGIVSWRDFFNFPIFGKELIEHDKPGWWTGETDAGYVNYISLGDFLHFMNNYTTLIDEQTRGSLTHYSQTFEQFKSYKGHFSCDPTMVILPRTPEGLYPVGVGDDITAYVNQESGTSGTSKFYLRSEIDPKDGYYNEPWTLIKHIFISTKLIKGVAGKYFSPGNEEKRTVYSFVTSLIKQVQAYMGNINNFGHHFYNDDTQAHAIVDIGTPQGTKLLSRPLHLSGLRSVYNNVSISSKLSPNTLAALATATQGDAINGGVDTAGLSFYNQGLEDRHIKAKVSTPSDDELKKLEQKESNSWKQVKERYKKFNKQHYYDPEEWSSLLPLAQSLQTKMVMKNRIEGKLKHKLVVPIELSFDTIGIGGLKNYTSFTVAPGVLPTKYDKDWGFIITHIEHTVKNEWITNVEGQFYSVSTVDVTKKV